MRDEKYYRSDAVPDRLRAALDKAIAAIAPGRKARGQRVVTRTTALMAIIHGLSQGGELKAAVERGKLRSEVQAQEAGKAGRRKAEPTANLNTHVHPETKELIYAVAKEAKVRVGAVGRLLLTEYEGDLVSVIEAGLDCLPVRDRAAAKAA